MQTGARTAVGLERTLPSSWYRTERIFSLEREYLLAREWMCAAREEELPHLGSYQVVDVVGEAWAICESVQEGIGARVHDHGFYAPMEDANLDIRRYVRDRLAAV